MIFVNVGLLMGLLIFCYLKLTFIFEIVVYSTFKILGSLKAYL